MKNHMVKLLRQADGPLTAVALSELLRQPVSSVEEQIHDLTGHGYPIVLSGGGYVLTRDPDYLYPWEFPGRQDRIVYFQEISSTMDEAKKLAKQGCPHLTAVIAERQTKGRGRMDRDWDSREGGLYFTLVIRPTAAPKDVHLVLFCASVCLCGVIRGLCDVDVGVKWPNDLLANEKKICGMLAEMQAEGEKIKYINLGIGLNVNNRPQVDGQPAASLKQIAGRSLSRRQILSGFLDLYEKSLENLDSVGIMDQWRGMAATLGRKVRVVTLRQTLTGVARAVDNDGSLVVEKDDGTVERVTYGDCFHRLEE